MRVYWFNNSRDVEKGVRDAHWIADRLEEAVNGEWNERWDQGLRGEVELSVSGVPIGWVEDFETKGWPLFGEMVPVEVERMKKIGDTWPEEPMRESVARESAAAEVLRKLREKRKRDAGKRKDGGSGSDSPETGTVAR